MSIATLLNRTRALRRNADAFAIHRMRRTGALAGVILACVAVAASADLSKQVELYQWVDFPVKAPGAAAGVAKWDVEGSCTWTYQDGSTRRTSLLWYSGSGDTYVYRFGGSLPGRWKGITRSPVAALDHLGADGRGDAVQQP